MLQKVLESILGSFDFPQGRSISWKLRSVSSVKDMAVENHPPLLLVKYIVY